MNSILWSLVPDSALPLIIVGLGLAVIVGLVKPRGAMSIICILVLSVLTAPLLGAVFAMLPWWLRLLIAIGFVAAIARALIQLVLGKHVTEHVAGTLIADAIRGMLHLAFLPIRILARMVR